MLKDLRLWGQTRENHDFTASLLYQPSLDSNLEHGTLLQLPTLSLLPKLLLYYLTLLFPDVDTKQKMLPIVYSNSVGKTWPICIEPVSGLVPPAQDKQGAAQLMPLGTYFFLARFVHVPLD